MNSIATLNDMLLNRASCYPNDIALSFPDSNGVNYSYNEVIENAKKYAYLLRQKSSDKRPIVIICCEPCAEWFWFFWGTIFAGGTAIVISPNISKGNFKYVMEQNNVDIIVASSAFLNKNSEISRYNKYIFFTEQNRQLANTDYQNHAELNLKDSEAICLIQYTSGTNGQPKGVKLSHRALLYTAESSLLRVGATVKDNWLLISPLYHIAGIYTMLLALFSGAALSVLEIFTPKHAVDCIIDNSITATVAVPTIYQELIERVKKTKQKITTLKRGVIAGAYIPSELIENIYNIINMNGICPAYGMTEFSAPVAMCSYTDSLQNKKISVGTVLDGTDIKIIDIASGKEIFEKNIKGEICLNGKGRMSGYVDAEDVCTEDGYYRSGDEGMYLSDGKIAITGRIKDIIIRCGENISSLEIEKCIRKIPGVLNAAISHIPDKSMGEKIIAFVIFENNEEYDINYVKQFLSSHIESYKIPDEIVVKYKFPKTENGKIDISKMLEEYMCCI